MSKHRTRERGEGVEESPPGVCSGGSHRPDLHGHRRPCPTGGPSADQPPSIGGRPPPPAPRAREPTAAPAPAVFRQVAQGRHRLLLHLPPKKALTVALIAYYGNSSSICNRFSPSPRPAQRSRPAPMATADQLTTAPTGWGVVYRPGHRIGAESLHNSSPSPHVLSPVSLSSPLRGGSLENRGQKTEKSKRGQKKFL